LVSACIKAIFLDQAHHFGLISILDIDLYGQDLRSRKRRFHFFRQRIHAAVAQVNRADEVHRCCGRNGFPHLEAVWFWLRRRCLLCLSDAQTDQEQNQNRMDVAPLQHAKSPLRNARGWVD
jgi:hypothetical protein